MYISFKKKIIIIFVINFHELSNADRPTDRHTRGPTKKYYRNNEFDSIDIACSTRSGIIFIRLVQFEMIKIPNG